jgi:hypothetical protein
MAMDEDEKRTGVWLAKLARTAFFLRIEFVDLRKSDAKTITRISLILLAPVFCQLS